MTVFGSYPCCGGPLMLDEGSDPPWPKLLFAFCPHCGAKTVHRLSKIDPVSWLESDFPDWEILVSADGEPVGREQVEWQRLDDN